MPLILRALNFANFKYLCLFANFYLPQGPCVSDGEYKWKYYVRSVEFAWISSRIFYRAFELNKNPGN